MLATLTGKQRRHVSVLIARANGHHLPSLAVCALAPDIVTWKRDAACFPRFNLFVAHARQALTRDSEYY
jgi:hypothetical protein